jgi:CubicO group peptidase (beta-lactamase class C family)
MAMELSSPESVGIDPEAITRFADALDAGRHGVHGLVIARHGRVVAEGWWHPYRPDDVHMMFSVSKTVTSLAVGIAISEGLLGLDEPTHAIFPEHREIPGQTIRHLLTMTTGHGDDVFGLMRALPERDWAELFFETPAEYPPGEHYVYNTASTYMLGAAVARRAGANLTEYLQSRLYDPLGWGTPHWERNAAGIEHGGTGLKLTTRQLAQLGQLLLQRGAWEGRQLVPAEYVDEASAHQTRNPWFEPSIESRLGYGFQLWRSSFGFRADGMCGQFAVVIPELDLVVATTSGSSDANQILTTIWAELLPGVAAEHEAGDADGRVFQLEGRSVPEPKGAAADAAAEASLDGRVFTLQGNPSGIERLAARFAPDTVSLDLSLRGGASATLVAGRTEWVYGETSSPLEELPVVPCAARASFLKDGVLEVDIQLIGTPFRWAWHLRADGPEGAQLTGRFTPDLGLSSHTDLLLTPVE